MMTHVAKGHCIHDYTMNVKGKQDTKHIMQPRVHEAAVYRGLKDDIAAHRSKVSIKRVNNHVADMWYPRLKGISNSEALKICQQKSFCREV